MRFTDIDVNFDITYEGYQNWAKIISSNILRIFKDLSLDIKLTSISVNLIMSIYFFYEPPP